MREPITHGDVDSMLKRHTSNPTAVAGDAFLALQIGVLIEIREELTALREQMRPVDTRMPR